MPLTTHLCENEVEILQNGDIHLAQIPDFEMGYIISRTIWHTEVIMAHFLHFYLLSFEPKLFFTRVSL